MSSTVHLVVTDLDGSLLDHDDYSYEPAKPVLQVLEEMRIPVVLASSKTRAEMLELRHELENEHPFIAENGAAIYIPERYFQRQPEGTELREGFWVRELAPSRAHWSSVLDQYRQEMPGCFLDFATAGTAGIAEMTGLSLEKAALANKREYSEPVQWRGSDEQLELFLSGIKAAGARVLKGGRFYSVSGDCDKGQALLWLRQEYALAAGASAVYDLAVGDGENDVPMLEVARHALQIPAHNRALPELERDSGVIVGEGFGPEAWSVGVREWLRGLYKSREEV
ncbi:HAD-IIB family hydrolase [Congregibacter brevis]|uniref:HAD-IIB family hydrolase n=1 Tax=Congregibacter brevis TaxID=3081201 RepID=A0ABZ0ICJ4_9GAMM|nr:HAD-IIB family hydrolase [Congregibacter sp. IMCC45268]